MIFGFCTTLFFESYAIPRAHAMVVEQESKMSVIVSAVTFDIPLEVDKTTTVAACKEYIELKKGIPVSKQELYVRARHVFSSAIRILDDKEKIGSLNLKSGSTIKLLRRRS